MKEAEEAKRWLRVRRICPLKLANDDAVSLYEALRPDEGCLPSSYDARSRVSDILLRYGSEMLYIRLAEAWLQQRAPGSPAYPYDVVIRLVSAYRGAAKPLAAREWVERVTRPEVARDIHRNQLAVLFTQRAAICLDFYERDGNKAELKEARRFADRSWAIGRSEACSLVYQRLKKLVRE